MLVWEQLRPRGHTTVTDTLGAYLESIRLRNGWSRQEAANRAGLSKGAVTGIINGTRRPKKETLIKIVQGWGLVWDDIARRAGLPVDEPNLVQQATQGLTADHLAVLASLTDEQRHVLVEMARQLRGSDTSQ